MALIDLAREQDPDEIRTLVSDLEAGRLPDDQEDRLEELVRRADDREQVNAIDENPAIADLIGALDLPPPTGFGPEREKRAPPPEEEVEVEVEEQLTGVPGAERRPDQGIPGRPDPRFARANLPQRFPQPDIRAQFEQLETARRNFEDRQDRDIPPREFWEEFADQVLPGAKVITKQEFVEAEQSSGATGMFT